MMSEKRTSWSAVSIGKQGLRQMTQKLETFARYLQTRPQAHPMAATACRMASYDQILLVINRWFAQFAVVAPGGPLDGRKP